MDLKTEIIKILKDYGCLQKHKNEGVGEVYNQIRNEDLVNDLFALYIVSNRRELLLDFADLVMINDCDLHTKEERALAVDRYIKGKL